MWESHVESHVGSPVAQYLGAHPWPKILKKCFKKRPEARNSEIGEIMKEGWSSHLWSDFDGNCIFVDGLGAI